jgi:hypothetical protein
LRAGQWWIAVRDGQDRQAVVPSPQMRYRALAGSAVIATSLLGVAVAGGSEGASGERSSSVSAASERPPHTGCGQVPRGTAVRPQRGRDLILGPVAFLSAVSHGGGLIAESDMFEREPGERHTGLKSPAILKRGTVATVVVPRSERPKLKIDFSIYHRPGFKSQLEACGDHRTGFPGGFRFGGPLCTKLRVRIEGGERPITKPISFGAGECPPG